MSARFPRIGFGITRFCFRRCGLLFGLTQQGNIGARGEKRLRFQARGLGFRAFFGKARQLRFKGCDAAFGARITRGQFTFSAARGGGSGLGGAPCIARSGFGTGGFRFGGFGSHARGFGFRCRDFRLIQPRFGGAERIALRQPHRARRWRAGVMRMTIPAPNRAFFCYQRLPRPQPRLQRRTIHPAREQTHLRERARQGRRRFHKP